MVWSWNDNDPVNDVPTFHQKMGTTSLNLLGGLLNRPADPADAMTLSITAKNVSMIFSSTQPITLCFTDSPAQC